MNTFTQDTYWESHVHFILFFSYLLDANTTNKKFNEQNFCIATDRLRVMAASRTGST